MTNYRFSDGDEEILRRILHKVGLWADIEQRLAPPIGRSTGAGRKSRVYFVFIPTGDGTRGRYLVAKFDEEGRQRQEWAALQELTQIDTPLEMLLPIAGNEPGDGAIVFQAAQGVMGHLACMDLLDVLRRQIEHNPGNCVRALKLAAEVLGSFYDGEPGSAHFAVDRQVVTWADEFELEGRTGRQHVESSLSTAGDCWPDVDWSVVRSFNISRFAGISRQLPNPFVALANLSTEPAGRVMLSRIHGDLNLGNIVISLGVDMRPERAFVIDFTNCSRNRIQAVDFARLEVEIWRRVLPPFSDSVGERELIQSFVSIRDYLDGREARLSTSAHFTEGLALVVDGLREMAGMRLSPDLRRGGAYLFRDYVVCLLLSSLSRLRHADVARNSMVARVMLISAALAAEYLDELEAGKYSPGSTERRSVPPRGLSVRRQPGAPRQDAAGGRPPVGVPPSLPPLVVGREDDVERVTGHLLRSVNSGGQVVIVRGWPGVGKTTLAKMVAKTASVVEFFRDGIVWTDASDSESAWAGLERCIRQLSDERETDDLTQDELVDLLRALTTGRRILVVVDDVWRAEVGLAFRSSLSSGSGVLFTTRSRQVAREIEAIPGHEVYRLGVLAREHGVELVEALAPAVVQRYRATVEGLVGDLEGLPLALQVAGRLLAEEESLGLDVKALIREIRESHRLLEEKAPEDRFDPVTGTTPTIRLLFGRSTDRLDPAHRERFISLGAFAPKPALFDLEFLSDVWEVVDPVPTLRRLADLGLVEPGPERGQFQVHALLVAHARSLGSLEH